MIKVGVFYPQSNEVRLGLLPEQSHADGQKRLMPTMKKVEIEKGVAGGAPGTDATYQCICNLHFNSAEAFQAAFGPHANEIMGDIANYTDAQPVVQISEVKM